VRSPAAAHLTIVAVALSAFAGCQRASPGTAPEPRRLRMLVRNPVGISHDVLQHYARTIPGVTATMDVVAGSDVVAAELQRGGAEVGFAQASSVYAAFRAGLPDDPKPFANLRAIAVVGRSSIAIGVRRDSPVRCICDLGHKRIGSVYERATQTYMEMILDSYGVPSDQVEFVPASSADRIAGLENGSFDAAVLATTAGPEFASWSQRIGLRLLDIRPSAIARVRARYPFITPELIRRGTIPSLDADVHAIGVDYVLVTRADLDEDFVYQLTRGFVGQFEDFARRNPRELLVDPEQVLATPIPLHRGAERYYREHEILR
jgi:TRAP transporter TAXI family solute receptor